MREHYDFCVCSRIPTAANRSIKSKILFHKRIQDKADVAEVFAPRINKKGMSRNSDNVNAGAFHGEILVLTNVCFYTADRRIV